MIDLADLAIRHREQRDAHSTQTTGCSCGWCPSGRTGEESFLRQFGAHVADVVGAAARRAAAEDLRENASQAWGGQALWLTSGTHVADLAAEWVTSR